MKNLNWKVLWVLLLVSWIGMVHAKTAYAASASEVCKAYGHGMKGIAMERDAKGDFERAYGELESRWERASSHLPAEFYDRLHYDSAFTWKSYWLTPDEVYVRFYILCMEA